MFEASDFRKPGVSGEFVEEADRLRRDVTDLVCRGNYLRDETCLLVLFKSRGINGGWWGDEQAAYYVAAREKLLRAATAWKAEVESRSPVPMVLIERIFRPKDSCQFADDVLRAAAAELGIELGRG
jgi:hypothetical protein